MAGRKVLLKKAIEYWWRQDYPNKELIIVDDDPAMKSAEMPVPSGVRYIHLERPHTLGAKLNIGCREAKGEFFHKIDDDDWYRSDLISLSATMAISAGTESRRCIVSLGCYYTLLLREWRFVYVGPKLRAGTSMFMGRWLWEQMPWNDSAERGADWLFYGDHPTHRHMSLIDPGLCTTLRHGLGHAWVTRNGVSVEDDFKRSGVEVPREKIPMSDEDLAFYRELRESGLKEFVAPSVAPVKDRAYWVARARFRWGSAP